MLKCFAAAVAIAFVATPVLAQDMPAGDKVAGEKTFKQCGVCHNVGPGAKNKVGPEQNGLVGRKIASVEGFAYSPAMKAYGEANGTWTPELLNTYLENPRGIVKGTKMQFAGLKKPEDRANVIAYLAGFNADGSPH